MSAPGSTPRKACGKEAKLRPDPDWMDRIATPADIRLRRLQNADSIEDLTDLLHRAFSRIGAMGIPCSCASQSPEMTRQRISRGECFVALHGGVIVGTITLYPPDASSASAHYRNDRVATLRQLAVDPRFHGRGIGSVLLRLAEHWALQRGYPWLALDTPEAADHLIDYYQRQGFGITETLQFTGRTYRSVVFSKSLAVLRQAPAQRALAFQSGKVTVATMTVTAAPHSTTRSPFSSHSRLPPRLDSWRATRLSLPSRFAQ